VSRIDLKAPVGVEADEHERHDHLDAGALPEADQEREPRPVEARRKGAYIELRAVSRFADGRVGAARTKGVFDAGPCGEKPGGS